MLPQLDNPKSDGWKVQRINGWMDDGWMEEGGSRTGCSDGRVPKRLLFLIKVQSTFPAFSDLWPLLSVRFERRWTAKTNCERSGRREGGMDGGMMMEQETT